MLLTEDDRKQLLHFFHQMNTSRRYRDYPVVHYVAFAESPARLGCMMGGLSHLCIDSRGNINPCVFLPVTFGNIMEEDFQSIYRRMRVAIPHPLHKECPSRQLQATLRHKLETEDVIPVPHGMIEAEWQEMFREK